MSNILSHGWGFIQIPEYWKVTLYNHNMTQCHSEARQLGTDHEWAEVRGISPILCGHGTVWRGKGREGQLWSICSATLLDSSSLSRRGETIHSLQASIMLTSSWDFIYSAGCPNQRPNIIRLLNKEIKYSPLCLLVLWIRSQGQSAAVATPLVEFSVVEIWLLKLSQNCQRMVPNNKGDNAADNMSKRTLKACFSSSFYQSRKLKVWSVGRGSDWIPSFQSTKNSEPKWSPSKVSLHFLF